MEHSQTVSICDNVKIATTPETIDLNVNGLIGQVYGITTPSSTQIDYVGYTDEDRAINVWFEDKKEAIWFAPNLVEFVDFSASTEIQIGNNKSVRKPDGTWSNPEPKTGFVSFMMGLFK